MEMSNSQFWTAVFLWPLGLLLMYWRLPWGGRLHLISTLLGAGIWLGLAYWLPIMRNPRYLIVSAFFLSISLIRVRARA